MMQLAEHFWFAQRLARALLRAKAAAVDVLVFARVVDTHKAPI